MKRSRNKQLKSKRGRVRLKRHDLGLDKVKGVQSRAKGSSVKRKVKHG